MSRPPNCLTCTHFRPTGDPRRPRSCDAFGFQSPRLPSLTVYEAVHAHCPAWEAKPPPAPAAAPAMPEGTHTLDVEV
jgi:hypothetical protein